MDEVKWYAIRIPQRVSDDEIPWDRYYLIDNDTGDAVAEIIGCAEDNAYTLCKRLNIAEDYIAEQKRLEYEEFQQQLKDYRQQHSTQPDLQSDHIDPASD